MFTASSTSAPTLADKLLAEVSKDVSARPVWFLASSGLDGSVWQVVEYPDNDLTKYSLRQPADYKAFKLLPKPVSAFTPRTELASRLWEIRKRIVASGEPLLDWDGVQKELSQRRAERG